MNKKEVVIKLANLVISCSILTLFLLGSIFYYVEFHLEKKEKLEESKAFCGVVDYSNSYVIDTQLYFNVASKLDSEFNPAIGENLFNTYCTSCHKINGRKLLGPPLNGLANRIPEQNDWLREYIQNEDLLHTQQDSYTLAVNQLNEKMEWQHEFDNLNETEITNLIGFLLMNE